MVTPDPDGGARPEPEPTEAPAATEQAAVATNPAQAVFSASPPSPGSMSRRWRIGDGGPRCRRYRRRCRIGG